MKKKILIIGSLCALGLVGCQRRDLIEHMQGDLIEVEVSGRDYTKAGEDASSDGELLAVKKFVTEQGDTLYISAYLSDMEDHLPLLGTEETKGAPISESNLGTLYGTINTTVYDASGSVYVSEDKDGNKKTMKDVEVSFSSDKWSFNDSYYWPKAGGDLYFCSMAPVELLPEGTSPLVSNIAWDKDSKLLTFDYTMPEPEGKDPLIDQVNDAVNQKDILVGVDANNKSGGKAKINLYHSLTGVRFMMGESNSANMVLTSASLNNFYSKGTATLDPSVTFSESQPNVTWTGLGEKKSFVQSYGVTTWAENVLLDATGEKTFMVIPQELGADAEMSVLLAHSNHPKILNFSVICADEPKLKDWSGYAGKMITFRISSYVGMVSVAIDDDCSVNADGYGVKDNIKITNDGTEDAYVRMEIVGNWTNENGQIVISWKDDNPLGKFSSKYASDKDNLASVVNPAYWTKGSDGFYYYKNYLKPGALLKYNLFESFVITRKPPQDEGSLQSVEMKATDLELVLLVQAVRADAGMVSAKAAWGNIVETESLLSTNFDDVE